MVPLAVEVSPADVQGIDLNTMRFGPLEEEQRQQVLTAGPDEIDRITFALLNAANFDDAVKGSNPD